MSGYLARLTLRAHGQPASAAVAPRPERAHLSAALDPEAALIERDAVRSPHLDRPNPTTWASGAPIGRTVPTIPRPPVLNTVEGDRDDARVSRDTQHEAAISPRVVRVAADAGPPRLEVAAGRDERRAGSVPPNEVQSPSATSQAADESARWRGEPYSMRRAPTPAKLTSEPSARLHRASHDVAGTSGLARNEAAARPVPRFDPVISAGAKQTADTVTAARAVEAPSRRDEPASVTVEIGRIEVRVESQPASTARARVVPPGFEGYSRMRNYLDRHGD